MLSIYQFQGILIKANIYYEQILTFIADYFAKALEHTILWFVAYIATCIILYITTLWWKVTSPHTKLSNGKRVLIVTAHPDDECMFFGPTILNLVDLGFHIYLVCLSVGNDGKSNKTRKNELYSACEVLGIPQENITIHDNEYLQDSMKAVWKEDLIGNIIIKYIETLSIDTLITFDKNGISGHPNHKAIYYGVAYLFLENQFPSYCKAYTLETVNILRKYVLFLDFPISFVLSTHWSVLNWTERERIQKAMKRHKSQMVWFRKLYITFSRYLAINTLQEITLSNIELELLEEP